VESVTTLVPFILIVGAFYVLIIRPSRNRQRKQQQLLNELSVGAQVMTTSGLYGEVVGIDDNGVLLEVAPGVTMRWTKAAVARILPEPDAADDSDHGATDTDGAADAVPEADSTERPT
jgi:preprotein translocase subunit YajC